MEQESLYSRNRYLDFRFRDNIGEVLGLVVDLRVLGVTAPVGWTRVIDLLEYMGDGHVEMLVNVHRLFMGSEIEFYVDVKSARSS